MTRLLANDDQRKVFEEHFHGRTIFTPKYVNWTPTILRQMWNVRGSQIPLPNALFITKILEHFGVSLHGETKNSRLSEGFSPVRERLTWEGEILGYTRGFSPERGLARLSESDLA
ncbi:hypothetical protein Lal_00039284 [Lupinus albus]|nr:hypothetical protein Lal_00039284 [Lupinus albus]